MVPECDLLAGYVTGKFMNIWDPVARKFRKVHLVLALAQADTPFRAIWALLCGHSSRTGCDKCFLRGTKKGPNAEAWGATRFGGYSQHAPTLVFDDLCNWEEGSDKEGVCLVGPLRPASGRQDGDDVRFCNGLLSTHSLASIFFMLCCLCSRA
jgi:hypothetical protein